MLIINRIPFDSCAAWGCNGEDLEKHHIIPRSQGGGDENWNLIPLCKKHHELVTNRISANISLLEKIQYKEIFKKMGWRRALDWHKAREKLRQKGYKPLSDLN